MLPNWNAVIDSGEFLFFSFFLPPSRALTGMSHKFVVNEQAGMFINISQLNPLAGPARPWRDWKGATDQIVV